MKIQQPRLCESCARLVEVEIAKGLGRPGRGTMFCPHTKTLAAFKVVDGVVVQTVLLQPVEQAAVQELHEAFVQRPDELLGVSIN